MARFSNDNGEPRFFVRSIFARNKNIFVIFTILYGGALSLFFFFPNTEFVILFSDTRLTINSFHIRLAILVLFFIIFSFIFTRELYFYLNKNINARFSRTRTRGKIDRTHLETRVDQYERKLDSLIGILSERIQSLSQVASKPAVELFKNEGDLEKFRSKLAAAIVKLAVPGIHKDIAMEIAEKSKFEAAIKHQFVTKERLGEVIDNLERRANTNLLSGVVIGIIGALVLIWVLFVSPPRSDAHDIVFHVTQYTSRFAVVFLIEVFAFFFLKKYGETIGELRYVHNELTNVETKIAGFAAAIATKDKNSIAKAIDVALRTERNIVLEKGRTTHELENLKSENEAYGTTLKSLVDKLNIVPSGTRPSAARTSRRSVSGD